MDELPLGLDKDQLSKDKLTVKQVHSFLNILKASLILLEEKNEEKMALFDLPGWEDGLKEKMEYSTWKSLEEEYIRKIYGMYRGNITRASKHMGISKAGLYRKLDHLGIKKSATDLWNKANEKRREFFKEFKEFKSSKHKELSE